ncbi:hypothetical protein [Micromonospora sp. b486]|uniref:hypothetical protein n=1 Tax=Micromonospora sp. b486 TaxID=3053986 RepID=UPI00259CF15D|nr:hypothetical protein [Micromonospora sp. b486]MDM4784605.1 hypothetical protein [Micromonospora sp. b486]
MARTRRRRRRTGWPARASEAAAGRALATRQRRYGPRTLDVDLIAVWTTPRAGAARDDPELTVPHPRPTCAPSSAPVDRHRAARPAARARLADRPAHRRAARRGRPGTEPAARLPLESTPDPVDRGPAVASGGGAVSTDRSPQGPTASGWGRPGPPRWWWPVWPPTGGGLAG